MDVIKKRPEERLCEAFKGTTEDVDSDSYQIGEGGWVPWLI